MAITINWETKVINIPRADLVLIQSSPTEIRELDLNDFREILNDLQDDVEGMVFDTTHNHIAPITVGGVTLARVVELINDYTVTFEDGQYAVNLKGANTNLADVVNVNQVSVRSSNSAGLQDLSTLLASAYMGEVCVDVINGQSGVTSPVGTRSTPVDNFSDAITIANNLGINTLRLMKSCTISSGDFSQGFSFIGDNAVVVIATLDTSADLTNCEFSNLTITGVLDGNTVVRECSVMDLTYFDGFLSQCALNGAITINNGSQATIADCFSNVAGGGAGQYPEINMGGGGTLALRDYNGGIEITNYSGGGDISLDMNSGRVIVADTVTAGDVYIRGIAFVIDNSTGTATVNDQTVYGDLSVINTGVQKASKLIPHSTDL